MFFESRRSWWPRERPSTRAMSASSQFQPVRISGHQCWTPAEVVEVFTPTRSLVPAEQWRLIGGFVRAQVGVAGFGSPWAAAGAMRTMTRFVLWCLSEDYPLEAERILRPDVVDVFIASLTESTHTRSTRRTQLRRIGYAATIHAPWPQRPEVIGRGPVQPPYTPDELDGYWAACRNQSTPRKTRVIEALLVFGLGAGLRTSEVADLVGSQVKQHSAIPGLVAVELEDRVVPIRNEYVETARAIARRTGENHVLSEHPQRRDPIERALRGVDLPRGLPPLRMNRLRRTWMLAVLSDGPLVSEFLRVAGCDSMRTVSHLIPYLPIRSEGAEYLRIAAGLSPQKRQ